MTAGQRAMRAVTTVVVRVPALWGLLRRPVAANFDRLAAGWDASRVDERRLGAIGAALAAVGPAPARALDLGTGSGAIARKLSERWPEAEVTGVDVSSQMIAEARRLSSSVRQTFTVADAARLPFPAGTFDLVALNNMIPFFDELARITARGGSVAIAYGLGAATPIWVPLDRVERELARRGFEAFERFDVPPGLALLARRPA
ncbi:MAG: methyltransferase domain-containing protein [Actinobacteria bacterium]|nr:methyltransferase domain-containing protein [Actinomycetota bacterium]